MIDVRVGHLITAIESNLATKKCIADDFTEYVSKVWNLEESGTFPQLHTVSHRELNTHQLGDKHRLDLDFILESFVMICACFSSTSQLVKK